MSTKLVVLAAASLLLSAEGVRAAPAAAYKLYVAGVAAQAEARLADAAVDLPTPTVQVRGVLRDNQFDNVRLVRSTGDLNADRAIQQALRRLKVDPTPADLAGREVVLTLGDTPAVQAGTP